MSAISDEKYRRRSGFITTKIGGEIFHKMISSSGC